MTHVKINLNSDETPPEPSSGVGFAVMGVTLLLAAVWLAHIPTWISLVLTASIFFIVRVFIYMFERHS